MVTVLVILVVLGLILGSFVNALVWRLRQQEHRAPGTGNREFSITRGRSQCPHCHHILAAKDLIPVASWLFLMGKCRYCGQSISRQYPLVEAATAIVFALSYRFWPGGVSGVGEAILFATWLAVATGLMALLVYDLRWMILPNKILYPTAFIAFAGRFIYLIDFEPHKRHGLFMWLLSLAAAAGVFWLLFTASSGRWIGYGDVRLGLITGTVLADPAKSLLMIFLASVIGCLFVLPALLTGQKHLTAKVPFGPFLILATGISLLFGESLINWYKGLLS